MLGAGGDADEGVTVAQVLIGEADLLRPEEKSGFGAGAEMLAEGGGSGFQTLEGFARSATAAVGGADDERAVGDGLGNGGVLFGGGEDGLGVDGGAGFAECDVVGMDHAEVERSEVGHRAGRCSDVERVTAGDEDDAETVQFCGGKHGGDTILRRPYGKRDLPSLRRVVARIPNRES